MIAFQYTVTFLAYPRKKFVPVIHHRFFPFASPVVYNVRHQPQIVLDKCIPSVVVARRHPFQTILLLFPGKGSGEGPRIPRQPKREKQSVQRQ